MSIVAPAARGMVAVDVDDATSVEAVIGELFLRKSRAAHAYGPHPAQLWNLAAQTVSGGKLVRPRLLLAAYRALSGSADVPQAVVDAAAAVELLHYAFVLHDDVIDGDTVRRGRPNLIGAMAARAPSHPRALHRGNTAAILMGDLVLSAAYQHLARLDVPAQTRARLLDAVDHTIDQTVAGEWVDVALADGFADPTLDVILEMSANKTACYTFELPLRLAAILADCTPQTERALATAGRHLGLAFQLDDDLLCAFGAPAEHGKDPLSDLREGKQTPIIAYARTTGEWELIARDVGRHDLSMKDAEQVRNVLISCGAKGFVERLRDASVGQVHRACGERRTGIPREAAQVLLAFANGLEGRRS